MNSRRRFRLMSNVTTIMARAKQIHGSEGWVSLVRRGFTFMLYQLYEYRTYYLTEYKMENSRSLNEADFMPRIRDFSFKTVNGNQEADELEAEGYEFRSYATNFDARRALDMGAIAFCVFAGRQLAAMGWAALSQRAFDSLNERPIKIDFSNRDAFIGGIWTSPRYRRMGLRTYRTFKLRQYLLDKGIAMTRGPIAKENIPALMGLAKLDITIYGEGRYLRVLWWKSWKEKPLPRG
jgi:hypothetical protein